MAGDKRGRRAGDLTPERMPSRRSFVSAYIAGNPYQFGIGLTAVTVGVLYLTIPELLDESVVGTTAPPLAHAWAAIYLVSGLMVVAGMVGATRRHAWRLELGGLFLMMGGLAGQSAAMIGTFGLLGLAFSTGNVYLILSGVIRARVILRLVGARTR